MGGSGSSIGNMSSSDDLETTGSTYDGVVTVGGPPQVRAAGALTVTKQATGPLENNCYLLADSATGERLLVDASGDAPATAPAAAEALAPAAVGTAVLAVFDEPHPAPAITTTRTRADNRRTRTPFRQATRPGSPRPWTDPRRVDRRTGHRWRVCSCRPCQMVADRACRRSARRGSWTQPQHDGRPPRPRTSVSPDAVRAWVPCARAVLRPVRGAARPCGRRCGRERVGGSGRPWTCTTRSPASAAGPGGPTGPARIGAGLVPTAARSCSSPLHTSNVAAPTPAPTGSARVPPRSDGRARVGSLRGLAPGRRWPVRRPGEAGDRRLPACVRASRGV